MPKRLLILSHDVVGTQMAGPGIRYWELARALVPHAAVTLAAPRPIDLRYDGLATADYRWGEAASLAALASHADVVLANGYLLEPHAELARLDRPLILDLYDPTLLENLEVHKALDPAERAERNGRDVTLLNRQLAAGDLFLCATERQRDLYIGALMAAGRLTPERADSDPQLRGLIATLGFGLPAEPPVRSGPGLRAAFPQIGPDDPVILWSGGLWDWMDPQTLVRAMPGVVAAIPNARLVFLAGAHPGTVGHPRAPDEARALASKLGMLGSHVLFYERWVPYQQRADVLLDATVVVSLHRQHLETSYAALRSRFLDHLWVGLPSVLADGDSAAALAREHGLGLVVPPQDEAAVADALCRLLAEPELCRAIAARARALAPRYQWPGLVRPILDFLVAAPAARPPRAQEPAMTAPQQRESRQAEDVARMERDTLLHATRNSAVQAVEHTWRLDGLASPARGRLGSVRQRLLDRVIWPLLHPLIARQQDHNAAVLRAVYALTEQSDHQRDGLVARLDQLAKQIRELHERCDELHVRCDDLLTGLREGSERNLRERHLVAQQVRDFAEQLAGLEEAELQIRALLRGEQAPPPATLPAKEA